MNENEMLKIMAEAAAKVITSKIRDAGLDGETAINYVRGHEQEIIAFGLKLVTAFAEKGA